MNIPLAYRIPVPESELQGVATADRPLCALISAYASWLGGNPLFGQWKLLSHREQEAAFAKRFAEFDVPAARALSWACSVRRVKEPFRIIDPTVGDFTLDPYQLEALSSLQVAGGVLALGCGLGKTPTAVKAAMLACASDARCWILCPLNAMQAWQRWIPVLKSRYAEVQVLSIDSAHKFLGCPPGGGVIIFDECHLLGDLDARRTKAAHQLRPMFDVGYALTGTLLHGGIEKCLSILDLAIPGAALFSSRWKAGEHFHCLVKKQVGSRRFTALEKPNGKNREAFLEYLSRYCVSMSAYSDVVRQSLQLPEQTIHNVTLAKPWDNIDKLAAQYARAKVDAGEELPHAQEVAHALCRGGLDSKIGWLLDAIDSPDIPVVVFAAYRESLDRIGAAFEEADISYVRVDGSITGAARIEAQRRFQAGEVQVFLGQMDAACTSMDLFRAQYSIAVDHTWKAANYNQALARTCRRGQERECAHFDLVANDLQRHVVARLIASEDFDSSLTEWQALQRAIQLGVVPCTK